MLLLEHLRDMKAIKKRADGSLFLAEWTGLEPATPGVTGRYSNQLNYHSKTLELGKLLQLFLLIIATTSGDTWWVLTGSNRRHSPCKGDALPAELSTLASPAKSASLQHP